MAETDVSRTAETSSRIVSDEGDMVPSATIRTRRRRERMRRQGIQSVVYELPSPIIAGIARVASNNGLTPSEYLTRLAASDLLRAQALPLDRPLKEAS